MFDTAMSKPADHPARIAAEEFVAARSHGASARSAALREPSPTMKRDFLAFVAERYFGTMAAAIRRHDPNHMVLGCRFAGMGASDVVLKAAGRHCDIVTFNCYPWADLDRGVMLTRKDGPPLVDAFREFHEKSPTPPSRRCSRGCTPPAHRYGSPIPGMRLSAASPARRGQRPHPR